MTSEEYLKLINASEEEIANEEWRDVLGWEGLFKVSSLGRVYSLRRLYRVTKYKEYYTKQDFCNMLYNSDKYLCVSLLKHKINKFLPIHRLVLESFCRLRVSEEVCRHLDGNKLNNRLSNLCWGTQKENASDRKKHGNDLEWNKVILNKLSPQDIFKIRELFNSGAKKIADLAREYSVHLSTIQCIINNVTWKDSSYKRTKLPRQKRSFSLEKAREIRALYDENGMTLTEIADLLGTTEPKIYTIVSNKLYRDENYTPSGVDNNRKRKEEKVLQIRKCYSEGMCKEEIMEKFSITRQQVNRIVSNRLYSKILYAKV